MTLSCGEKTNFIINDIGLPTSETRAMLTAIQSRAEFIVFDPRELSIQMAPLISQALLGCSRETTVILYPGTGALTVKNSLPDETQATLAKYIQYDIPAKRLLSSSGGVAQVRVHVPELGPVNKIVVIDDVVATGTTLSTIKTECEIATPDTFWMLGFAWLKQVASAKCPIMSWAVYDCLSKGRSIIPTNSLSTLLTKPEITTKYANKYFSDPAPFLKFIDHLNTYAK